jgi:hypothetical protein
LVWGWLSQRLAGGLKYETSLAVTPGLLLSFVALTAWVRRDPQRWGTVEWWVPRFAVLAAAVFALGWLLTVRVGTVSAYWLVMHVIPGAGAIRATGRMQLITNLWVVAAVALMLDRMVATAAAGARRSVTVVAAALLLFSIIEQVNLTDYAALDRRVEWARLDAVRTPAPGCQVVLVYPLDPGVANSRLFAQTEGIWIAQRFGLPTINGYAAFSPPGWRLTALSVDYLAAAHGWIRRSELREQVCLYRPAADEWTRLSLQPN